MKCKKCENEKLHKCGSVLLKDGTTKIRYRCTNCNTSFSELDCDKKINSMTNYVITSCQNNTEINKPFLDSLLIYCEQNNAQLLVLKTLSLSSSLEAPIWNVDPDYFIDTTVTLDNKVKVLLNTRMPIASQNPLGGIDTVSRGQHIIVGHPCLQMKTLTNHSLANPLFAYSTGSVSVENYSDTKNGIKAEFNHSFSAIFVNIKNSNIHLRTLIADEYGGFFDIDGYYNPNGFVPLEKVTALVVGDEHIMCGNNEMTQILFRGKDSIVSSLNPEYIIRHDILDFYSGSHHHKTNFLLRYKKHHNNTDNVEAELKTTINYINDTTPDNSISIIVQSNHNDHLTKWLNLTDPKLEPLNSKIYYKLMYLCLDAIEKNIDKSAFQLYCEADENQRKNVRFLDSCESFRLHGIELSHHGDNGINGSRGSAAQFSKLIDKTVIGHSHSPKIEGQCYQVGTSTGKLEYTVGLTTWANTHCIIYTNGTRQLITVVNGEWK